jgi:hypothetical protein
MKQVAGSVFAYGVSIEEGMVNGRFSNLFTLVFVEQKY